MLDSVLGLSTKSRMASSLRVKSFTLLKARSPRGFTVIHPRYRAWLTKHNLTAADDFFSLRGVVLSGHHDRHVQRVDLGGRVVYLKREHRVGWRVRERNRRAGFGRVSRSVREAKLLEHLAAQGLPGPQWIAYGEDGCGRAFVLIEDLAGCDELRAIAASESDSQSRRDVAERLGLAIAGLHLAKLTTPDLAAKHIFFRRATGTVTVIDWPSTTLKAASLEARIDALARLDASLAAPLASPRERLRMLRAYLRDLKGLPPLKAMARRIAKLSAARSRRATVRDQHTDSRLAHSQCLVWLADMEAVCVRPALADCWPQPAIAAPYYPELGEPVRDGERRIIRAPDGKPAMLLRWRTTAAWSRSLSCLRGRSWRSPAARYARAIFQQQRVGQPAPQLLAFGQRFTSPITAESFALIRMEEQSPC